MPVTPIKSCTQQISDGTYSGRKWRHEEGSNILRPLRRGARNTDLLWTLSKLLQDRSHEGPLVLLPVDYSGTWYTDGGSCSLPGPTAAFLWTLVCISDSPERYTELCPWAFCLRLLTLTAAMVLQVILWWLDLWEIPLKEEDLCSGPLSLASSTTPTI